MEEVPLIASLLDKAVRQYSLYGSGHNVSTTALGELHRHLNTFFEKEKLLSLDVKRGNFEWNRNVVFVLERKDNNYLLEMYIDGVRQITFMQGVDADELRSLVSVFAREIKQFENREDDTVTLLWKCGFKNIRTETVDVYAGDLNALLLETLLTESEKDVERDFLKAFIERLVRHQPAADESPHSSPKARLPHELASLSLAPVSLESFYCTEEQDLAVKEEIRAHTKEDFLELLRPVFAEVLEARANDLTFPSLLRSFMSLIKEAVEDGDVRRAMVWLQTLRELEPFCEQRNPEARRRIESELRETLSSGFFDAVPAKWGGCLPGSPQDWLLFFEWLGEPAIEGVCSFLHAITQETVRTAFVGFLSQHPPKDLTIFLKRLKSGDELEVRDFVRVLMSSAQDPRVLPEFRHMAIHPSAVVRVEIVRAMKLFTGDTKKEVLSRSLRDPSAEVRKIAVQQIGALREPAYARPLAEEVKKPDFVDRDETEKRLLLVSLARCAGAASIKFLEQILSESATRPEIHELRMAALLAIGEIIDPKADAILEKTASKMFENREMKDRARQLLARRSGKPGGARE
jgi:hypothetical protein